MEYAIKRLTEILVDLDYAYKEKVQSGIVPSESKFAKDNRAKRTDIIDAIRALENLSTSDEALHMGGVVGQSEQFICPNCKNPHLYLKADKPKIKHCPACSRTWAD